jgi:protease-4
MIDKLAYADQIREETGGEDRKKFKSYLRKRRSDWSSGSDEIAVIYAEGTIIDGNGGSDFFGGRYIGDRTLSKQLREAREDEDIKAVVLRVDSPGGSGSASDAIWREVALTREKKPVVVSMADYAASGGYYISMGATRIFAEPGTLTGSIGVFGGKLNLAGVYNQFGVVLHSNNRGEFADLLSETSNFDDSDRTKFRSFLTGFYDLFITKAAEGRGMEKDALHQVAQGRVWTGAQALERGLVDELGGLDAALAFAAKEANLSEYAIVRVPERRGFFDQLAEELNNPDAKDARMMLPGLAENLAPVVALERVLGEGNGVALLMPPGLRVE